MIPALRLDYGEVRRRVRAIKSLVDRAERAELAFVVDGRDTHALTLDLRHRTGHASDGVIDVPGTANNDALGQGTSCREQIAGDPATAAPTRCPCSSAMPSRISTSRAIARCA